VENICEIASDKFKQEMDAMFNFLFAYGFDNMLLGEQCYDAYSSFLSLINHGCNGSYNVNSNVDGTITEDNADPSNMPSITYGKGYSKRVINPVRARHIPHLIGGYDIALRGIKAGEELLDNYLSSIATEESWAETVELLKKFCAALQEEGKLTTE